MGVTYGYIKKFSIADAKILSELHKQCFTENWDENNFRNMLTDNHYFGFIISDVDKINCGFALCKHLFEEIEIITFCVLPKHRRYGFGKLLINEVIKYANTIPNSKIFLEVSKDNIAAINLYQSIGFKKIARRKDYYKTQNGLIDANIMMLEIKNPATE